MTDEFFTTDEDHTSPHDERRVSRATRKAHRAEHRAEASRARAASEQSNATVIVMLVALALILGVFGMLVFGPVLMRPTGGAGGGVPLTSSPTTTPAPTFEVTTVAEATSAAPPVEPEPAEETPAEKVIGKSVENRDIVAHRFGAGSHKLLILGGVHGDEWSPDAVDKLVERLKGDESAIPDGTEVHVIACLNPDGRKADTRGNANDVDINRNMPSANWSSKLDKDDSSAKEGLSGGPSAGSEPESKAFISYMDDNDFDVVVSVHSQGGLIDWDGPGESLAKRISKVTGLPAKHLGYQPYIRGSMGLFVPEKYDIPIITIEMSRQGLSDRLFNGIMEAAKP